MADIASQLDPTHIVLVGDNIYENGAEGDLRTIQHVWYDSFPGAHGSLQRPWHMIQGNHDWRSDPTTQIEFTWSSLNQGGFWNLPGFWYSKRVAANDLTIDFFYVDTLVWTEGFSVLVEVGSRKSMAELKEQQKTWLEKELRESAADWKIVVGHQVMYGDSDHVSEAFGRMSDLNELLQKYEVPIWLNGHSHNQEVVQFKGITYITTGAGCKSKSMEICKEWDAATCNMFLPGPDTKKFFSYYGGFLSLTFLSKGTAELVIYGNSSSSVLFTYRIRNRDHRRWLDVPTPYTFLPKHSCGSINVLSASECCPEGCCRSVPDMHVTQSCTDFCEFSRLRCVSAAGIVRELPHTSLLCGMSELSTELNCSMLLGDIPSQYADLMCHCEPKQNEEEVEAQYGDLLWAFGQPADALPFH
eukprot:CAMPEP_0115316702 /NCGR_PEP_ID=MMETSP0270-20121206/78268_1 /TAXON_ID=71861 /ORGANISM="Scrippsiella trochoidea, Strain CCMP3099" /LENGTH=413 /DNA_ID=CAMNT_0002736135 /DNA_START=274 /DNA_END=1513 /DNA_ORIENTATION=+